MKRSILKTLYFLKIYIIYCRVRFIDDWDNLKKIEAWSDRDRAAAKVIICVTSQETSKLCFPKKCFHKPPSRARELQSYLFFSSHHTAQRDNILRFTLFII